MLAPGLLEPTTMNDAGHSDLFCRWCAFGQPAGKPAKEPSVNACAPLSSTSVSSPLRT